MSETQTIGIEKDKAAIAVENFLSSISSHTSAWKKQFTQEVEEAKEQLEKSSFPTTRVEEWKYTRTTRISSHRWNIKESDIDFDVNAFLPAGATQNVIVFVNGFFSQKLSRLTPITGLTITGEAYNGFTPGTGSNNIFEHLNTAYNTGHLFIRLEKNIQVDEAVQILHIATGDDAIALPAIHVTIEPGSKMSIVESFRSDSPNASFINRSLSIYEGENASLSYDKIQSLQDSQFLLNHDRVHLEKNSRFTINTLVIDGGWTRNDLRIKLDGVNIEANLHGFYVPHNNQHVDNHTLVDHLQPHCQSNELYKGLLHDKSTGVFNGKVYVRPDAQKTNAYQNNANIIVGNDAHMYTKPELEIYADDVKCSHGTTTGQLDEDAMFYLRSRGLGEDNARRLLTSAFIGEVIDKIENTHVRDHVVNLLGERRVLIT